MWSNATFRAITNPSVRTKRLATSTAFAATFAAAILTVSLSASTILPCPANKRSKSRGTLADSEDEPFSKDAQVAVSMPMNGVGQRILLTRKGGWIEIDQPPHPTPSPSATN